MNIGETFQSLKPEVQTTLDKIFSQVELVSHTLSLLEKRLAFSEDRMMGVMNYIKENDVVHRPKIVQGYPQFSQQQVFNPSRCDSMGPDNTDFYTKPQEQEILASQESDQPTPMLGGASAYHIAQSLRSKEGGEDFFRATNVFAQ